MARARQIERTISKGQVIPLLFTQDQVADAQSAVAMNILETSATTSTLNVTEYVMPFDFEIIAVTVVANTPRTAGTLTVDATIDGTVTGLQAILNGTNTTRKATTQQRGSDIGVAGSRVGVKLTTASWTPVAANIAVTVWVLVSLEGI
jgi:hypothetical protein